MLSFYKNFQIALPRQFESRIKVKKRRTTQNYANLAGIHMGIHLSSMF